MSASPCATLARQDTAHAPSSSELSFATLVPRRLVHRRALAEVLLTDWCADGGDRYRVAAQWSRSHSLYRVRRGRYDPLVLAETLRQAGILLSHVGLGVPSDFKLVMDRLVWRTPPMGVIAGAAPAEVVGYVRLNETRRRTSCLTAFRIDIDFVIEAAGCVGRASGWARCVSPTVYTRLRGAARSSDTVAVDVPEPVDRTAVGVCQDDDVVLGAAVADNEWPLRVLTGHAVLFDHPLDHVPGMLILEGMRQAGRLHRAWPDAHIAACNVDFSGFVELDASPSVRATLLRDEHGRATFEMHACQGRAIAAAGMVTMRATSLEQ